MAVHSMTGYGSAAGVSERVEYSVEVRSVNNRYFKPSIRLPDVWSRAEADIEKLLRSRVRRGAVSVSVQMKVHDAEAAWDVNVPALNRYIEQLRPLEVEANPMLHLDIASMMQLPGVCEPPDSDKIIESSGDELFALINEAMDALLEMRRREGESIQQDLLENCKLIERHLETVRQRSPVVVEEYRRRLSERIRELTETSDPSVTEQMLSREVAVFADRCDIAEEVSRLGAHVEQFRKALGESEPSGRKLDFIAQEMLREANTIASKSGDMEISRAVVEIKTGVDRIKEQVQNVE
ncbi:MAG: YicC/YloC family endoribonuclease [Planctomycetota bacterium]